MRTNHVLSVLALGLAGMAAGAPVDFQREIRPLLAKKCMPCHGPDEHARKANFKIDTFDDVTGARGGYRGIVPGDSKQSRVAIRIAQPTSPMPPVGERLTPREVELIRSWIDSGAEYKAHWAFQKPKQPQLPAVSDGKWVRNGIDAFVLARLDAEKLKPAPEADPYVLARRVSLDLTGLPPDPSRAAAFVQDPSPAAYERLVDELLASPRFGERWARMWLDLARYADTQGYEKDNRRIIWPYRDWVIQAFNKNIPFDRFTILQLAGDLLPNADEQSLIATGFHRNTMTNTEGGTDDEEFRDAAVKDRVAVTGQVWMGLTWGCAQCHSHKYDPLTHKEFYQLYGFFNQTEDSDKPDDRPVLKLAGASTLILRDLPKEQRRTTRIHERGNFLNPGEPVEAATPEAFPPLQAGVAHDRLALANWLVSPANPLTARVQVNRFWARLFGRGIVETEEDFGTQGAPPSHPELLDWLATGFMNSGWDMKALLKTMVLSATYRQSSDLTPALLERDPNNRLLARGPRFRLDAEMVRDQALAASGLLSAKIGGPPVMPWQPEGVWQVVYNGDRWAVSPGEDRYRRGIYTFLRRSAPYPSMIIYDAPTGETCTMRRIRTNTPLQALAALNDPALVEAAQHLALRVAGEGKKSDKAKVEQMFEALLVRAPRETETRRILALYQDARRDLRARAESAQKLLAYDKIIYADDRLVTLVSDVRTKASTWKFTTEAPPADWKSPGFNDSGWQSGAAPFGRLQKADPERPIGTKWDAETIWLRIEFDLPEQAEIPRFLIRNLGSFEAFINGVPAASTNLDRNNYYEYSLAPEAARGLKPGRNVLAFQTQRLHESKDGQYFDASFVMSKPIGGTKLRGKDADTAAWVVVANALLNLDETVTRR